MIMTYEECFESGRDINEELKHLGRISILDEDGGVAATLTCTPLQSPNMVTVTTVNTRDDWRTFDSIAEDLSGVRRAILDNHASIASASWSPETMRIIGFLSEES